MLLKLSLKIYICLVAATSFAQNEHQVVKEGDQDSILIVIFPFFKKEFDDTFALKFSQGRFKIADTAQISHNLLNHELFNSTARKVIESASHKSKNIYADISRNEIDNFKTNTLYSDIILIHLKTTATTIEKVRRKQFIKIQGDILAYDLKSGEFVHLCHTESKVAFFDKAEGKAYAISKFAEEAYACFSEQLK